MSSVDPYSKKQVISRLSLVSSESKASVYSNRVNSSRLSSGQSDSQASVYTNRVNSSRLSGVNTDAFIRNASMMSRLGGEEELNSLLRIFYGKALHDPRISKLFDSPDAVTQEAQIQKQLAFLKAAVGGVNDGAVDLKAAYAHVASLGITSEQFDAFVAAVTATLRGQNVPPTVIGEVEDFCNGMRDNVVS
jgi:truncated hemoglobin YjbI